LPLANEGYEMFQPPLLLCFVRGAIETLRAFAAATGAVAALRLFGMAIGSAHWLLVWAFATVVWRGAKHGQMGRGAGGMLAGECLSFAIHHNEGFAAACVTACIYSLFEDAPTRTEFVEGTCGAGILPRSCDARKSTALLALPAVFGALIWRALRMAVGTPIVATSS